MPFYSHVAAYNTSPNGRFAILHWQNFSRVSFFM